MRTLGDYSAFASTKHDCGTRCAADDRQDGADRIESRREDLGATLCSDGVAAVTAGIWTTMHCGKAFRPREKKTYQALLDPARFMTRKTHTLIHLPENYFGVAARIAAIDYDLGLNKDRGSLDDC